MKVLFLVNNYPDDKNPYAGIFVHNQIKVLLAEGIDACVLYFDFRSIRRVRKWGMSQYEYNGVKVYRYAIPCGPVRKLYIQLLKKNAVKAYKKVCKMEDGIELLHAHFTDMGIPAAKIKEKFGIKYILTEHSSTLLQEEICVEEKKLIKEAYENADCILAVGTTLKQNMRKYTTKEIEVVPNILPNKFRVMRDIQKESDKYAFVSVVGTLTKDKKVDLLVQAFAELSKRYENIVLKICGCGNLMDEVKNMVSDIGLEEKVEFLGVIKNDKLPEILNACDCFVLPSIVETFGVVYIEAAGCGLPVIAANSGGTLDIVEDSNGVRIPYVNVEELVDAMEKMIIYRERYLPDKISEEIHKKFGEKAFVKKIEKVYAKVLMEA